MAQCSLKAQASIAGPLVGPLYFIFNPALLNKYRLRFRPAQSQRRRLFLLLPLTFFYRMVFQGMVFCRVAFTA